jgi:uncharacterized protein (TIGR03000 family)
MYSVVLMAALTSGVDMPDFGRRGGGCCGCSGGYSAGCYGGGRHGRHGGGCCGTVYSYGCYGSVSYGGGFGYGGGCYGSGYGYGGGFGYGGGCYGSGYGYGGGFGYGGGCYGGGYILPGAGVPGGHVEPLKTKPKEKGKEEEVMGPAPATIVVELPADAKLLIGDNATTSTGSSRVFQSPALEPGREYHYTVKAEVIRDGKPVKVEQVIAVKAGETTPVTLTLPATGVAQR